MNVAWRGTRRSERGSTGVETSSRMGVVTGDALGRMRCYRNSIIDLRRGWTMGPSKTSSVSRSPRPPSKALKSIAAIFRLAYSAVLHFAILPECHLHATFPLTAFMRRTMQRGCVGGSEKGKCGSEPRKQDREGKKFLESTLISLQLKRLFILKTFVLLKIKDYT
ncbi:hypothetical protein ALC62_04319 [Cyphomyrmex costatus]|uniref:Uncharacterized protein n=1 Tax=Cyphomyrmex costatus TaxID=456900 RepID=A0A195CXQ7_9HYME|nr:hypothetical protein ALC62_04319 [Cyphomyrmex costatus]